MARTRAQQKAEEDTEPPQSGTEPKQKQVKSKTPAKREEPEPDPDAEAVGQEEPAGGAAGELGEDAVEPPPGKKTKVEGVENVAKQATSSPEADNSKIKKLLDGYGSFPLQYTALQQPMKPTAEIMLAHLFNALLTSTRISHQLAEKTVKTVIEAGWVDLSQLEANTWEKRTEVLTEGGFTHYREKTATQLGDLAEWLRSQYDGDLNNLLKAARDEAENDSQIRDGVCKRLQEIKGLGPVALDIFCDTAQGVWHELAPFLDLRSQKAAEEAGLPSEVDELYAMVGNDPVKMCRLALALTRVRLEKGVDEIAAEGEDQ